MIENVEKMDKIYICVCLMNIMKSQNKIAVDIVLLSPNEGMGNAIEVNQTLAICADNVRRCGAFRIGS